MSYVLILFLAAYGSDGGNALTTAAFETAAACEAAGAAAKGFETRNYNRIQHRCVQTK